MGLKDDRQPNGVLCLFNSILLFYLDLHVFSASVWSDLWPCCKGHILATRMAVSIISVYHRPVNLKMLYDITQARPAIPDLLET
jgi:hypothetical protein